MNAAEYQKIQGQDKIIIGSLTDGSLGGDCRKKEEAWQENLQKEISGERNDPVGKWLWNQYKKSILVFLAFTAVGGLLTYEESQENVIEEDGVSISKNEIGEGTRQEELILTVPMLEAETEYEITVPEKMLSEQEREEIFQAAEHEITETFCGENESVNHIEEKVVLLSSLQDGLVEAEWAFDNYDVMNTDGTVREENAVEEGTTVVAEARLSYGEYEYICEFPFRVYPRTLTGQELVFHEVEKYMNRETEEEEGETFILPETVSGYSLTWKSRKEKPIVSFLFLGGIAAGLLILAEKSETQKQIEKRRTELLFDYPEMVSKLSLLLGAGMTVKAAWTKIADTYARQKERKFIKEKAVYEEMLFTCREIQDGTGELMAYEHFGERCGLQPYRKLTSLLTQNLRKGSKGLTTLMENEVNDAFDIRKNMAKKYGEEAGTKLLAPMMLMLFVVMVIIMVPALLSFQM